MILPHAGRESAPYGMAAMACAPPTRRTRFLLEESCGGQEGAVRPAAAPSSRRGAEDYLPDAGDATGYRGHEHGRGEGGQPAGDVDPDPAQRSEALPETGPAPLGDPSDTRARPWNQRT